MAIKLKFRVPMIVTADGRWAVNGSHSIKLDEVDWGWLDEMCDFENPTQSPQRYWIEVEVALPEERVIKATEVSPADA